MNKCTLSLERRVKSNAFSDIKMQHHLESVRAFVPIAVKYFAKLVKGCHSTATVNKQLTVGKTERINKICNLIQNFIAMVISS